MRDVCKFHPEKRALEHKRGARVREVFQKAVWLDKRWVRGKIRL